MPLELKPPAVKASAASPLGPPVLRQRVLQERAFGRAKLQEYLEFRASPRFLDTSRERLRKSIAIAESFEALHPVAQETQVMHCLAEAVYALDSEHFAAGKRRVYHAHQLYEALPPAAELAPLVALDRSMPVRVLGIDFGLPRPLFDAWRG